MTETEKLLLRLVALLRKEVEELEIFCCTLMDEMYPESSAKWRALDKKFDDRISRQWLDKKHIEDLEEMFAEAGADKDSDALREALKVHEE